MSYIHSYVGMLNIKVKAMIQVKFQDGVHMISEKYAVADLEQGVVYFYSPFFGAYYYAQYVIDPAKEFDDMLYYPEEISEAEYFSVLNLY